MTASTHETLTPPEDLVPVARTAGAYGVRGWVRVVPLGTGEALMETDDWWLQDLRGNVKPLTPVEMKAHGDVLLVRFEESTSKEDADRMKGRIAVPREHFPELEEGEHWVNDIEGSSVVNREGENLGTVESVVDNGGQQVLKIEFTAEGKKRMRLIPLVPAYVEKIDTEAGVVHVDWHADWD